MARTYTQLQADIAAWSETDDLGAYIPTFIEQAEDLHRYGDDVLDAPPIRVSAMSVHETVTVPDDNKRFLDLPEGYLSMRRLRLSTSRGPKRMNFVSAENLGYSNSSEPQDYTIHNQIEFDSDAAAGMDVELLYYRQFDRLTAENPTNWLLLNGYDAYLYASLVKLDEFVRDDESKVSRLEDYRRVARAINNTDRKGDIPRGRMQIRNTRVHTVGGLM